MMKTKRQHRSPSGDSMDFRCRLGTPPRTDRGYFEEMTKAVFRSGMKWDVIDKKWSGFKKAFAHFSIPTVSRFEDSDLERLMNDAGIIRNLKKVTATIRNAQEFLRIRKEYGSFAGYLKSTGRTSEENLCKDIEKRFAFMGGSTTLFFLRAVGKKMPVMMQQRQASYSS